MYVTVTYGKYRDGKNLVVRPNLLLVIILAIMNLHYEFKALEHASVYFATNHV